MQNFQQRPFEQNQQSFFTNNAPNSSVTTMRPDTFQNSPFTQGGFNVGNPNQQYNQQAQEQNYLQNVRQEIGTSSNQVFSNQQPTSSLFNQQPAQQQFSQFQPFGSQNNSLATMGPSTYQGFQAFQQRHNTNMTQQQQPNLQNNAPNSSVATMGPSTFQNSPFTQGGFNVTNPNQQYNQQAQEQNYLQNVRQELDTSFNQQFPNQQFLNQQPTNSVFNQQPAQQQFSQYQPFGNQSNSLATMGPSTYQGFQAFQQRHNTNINQQQQPNLQNNAPNSSVATMGPSTFQNSPFTQGGFNVANPNQQYNQQAQEQNYLQNVRQELGTQRPFQ
ncbi:MAG: hypothetical protein ACOYJ1_10775 [Peptococcales bacterium]|jgi:hypothetical protein